METNNQKGRYLAGYTSPVYVLNTHGVFEDHDQALAATKSVARCYVFDLQNNYELETLQNTYTEEGDVLVPFDKFKFIKTPAERFEDLHGNQDISTEDFKKQVMQILLDEINERSITGLCEIGTKIFLK